MLRQVTVIVDTREKQPWVFPNYNTKRKALKNGDYSVVRYEKQIAIERKSVADLISSFTTTRKRMIIRLEAMGKLPCAALIVEGSVWSIITGTQYSNVNGRLLFGSVSALCAIHNVSLILADDREGAQTAANCLIEGYLRISKEKGNTDKQLEKRKRGG